jgi:hypothetical protein
MGDSNVLRCDEVTAELAAPGSGVDRAAVAAHLASCPRCGEWAARADALTRLWDATRPVEPSDAAWDALWSEVTARLDSAEVEESREVVPARRDTLWYLRVAALAQAAAVLAAVTLWAARRPGPPAEAPAPAPAASVLARVDPPALPALQTIDIPEGEVGVIREDARDKELHLVGLSLDDHPDGVAPSFSMLNVFEAIAE